MSSALGEKLSFVKGGDAHCCFQNSRVLLVPHLYLSTRLCQTGTGILLYEKLLSLDVFEVSPGYTPVKPTVGGRGRMGASRKNEKVF